MIKVLHPGVYNSIQDKGRVGYSHLGVPQSGYMDVYAASVGNALLNNSRNTAVVEITFGQGKFKFLEASVLVITGADYTPKINNKPIAMKTVYKVAAGAVLSFGKRKFGARTYLAIQGGVVREPILNSMSSTDGLNQVRLKKGDEILFANSKKIFEQPNAKMKVNQEHYECPDIACYPGPEFDSLTEIQQNRLAEAFTISEDNNRVGYRLNEVLENTLKPIITSGVLPGTVQLTPSGQLIVLMKDCQVTGGYPRVLQLSDYAVSKLSQKVAGDTLMFKF